MNIKYMILLYCKSATQRLITSLLYLTNYTQGLSKVPFNVSPLANGQIQHSLIQLRPVLAFYVRPGDQSCLHSIHTLR